MVFYCCVASCHNNSNDQKMHIPPKNKEMFTKWMKLVSRTDITYEKRSSYRICDAHFSEDMKYPTFHNRTNLNVDAVPDLCLPTDLTKNLEYIEPAVEALPIDDAVPCTSGLQTKRESSCIINENVRNKKRKLVNKFFYLPTFISQNLLLYMLNYKKENPSSHRSKMHVMRRRKHKHRSKNQLNISGEIFNKYDKYIWKRIFYLPTEPVWYYAIIVFNYLTITGHLYVSTNNDCLSEKMKELGLIHIFNIMDVVYLVDIILVALSLYIPNLNLPDVNVASRPIYIILMELLSLIPLQEVLRQFSGTIKSINMTNYYCVLRLNVILRVIRIIYFYHQLNILITSNVYMKVLQLLSHILFIVITFFATYCNIFCSVANCDGKKVYCNRTILPVIIKKSIGAGYKAIHSNIAWDIIGTLAQVTVFYCIYAVMMAHLTIRIITSYRHQIKYLDLSSIIVTKLKRLELPKRIINKAVEYFVIIWSKTKGYSRDTTYWNFLHFSMRNELMIDTSWPAFQHSSLFRSMDFCYLRYLSNFIKLEYMLPGQYLFTKGEWKSKMVYIASGTIHLISNEDRESPLISFSAGTCIGESCLVIDYRSLNHVVCKTFCQFHILNKQDFVRSYLKYSEEFKHAQQIILERYANSRILNDISIIAKEKLNAARRKIDIYTLLWVKNTLHKLMAVDEESTRRHEFQNIYFISEVDEDDFNKLSFSARYLDMLVVSERIEVDTDTVFVRIHFPCIFQPNSMIGVLWELLIIFVTVILSFIIPHMALIQKKGVGWYDPLVWVITKLYWLDVYIQLSTAIHTKHGASTKIKNIAKAKMQTVGLWVDIISCIPCEIFINIVSEENTPQINAILHFNRLLKLWRIEKIFCTWESNFNVNLGLIRYIKFSWINLYTIFVFYCMFYQVKKGENIHMLFAAVQMVSGIDMYDASYSPSIILSCIGNLLAKFITLILYASIMSAHILLYMKRVDVRYMYMEIFSILSRKNITRKFVDRIVNILYTEWDDNEGTSMKQSVGITCDVPMYIQEEIMCHIAEDCIKNEICFSEFSDIARYDICANLKYIVWPSDEPVSYPGQMITTIYFLLHGSCEILNDYGDIIRTVENKGCFNILETLFKVPAIQTIVTRSNCTLLSLEYKHLCAIMQKYIYESSVLSNTIAKSNDIKESIMKNVRANKFDNVSFKLNRKQNVFRFDIHLQSTYAQYEYNRPFEEIYPLSYIRYFLLRITINCEGRFLYWWEVVRCILAILTGFLYFVMPIYMSKYRMMLYLLDITGAIDIYLRLHICYFNEKGLRITHPLKTAANYLRTAFFIDFVAILPTGLLISQFVRRNNYMYFVFYSNKLLPLYRYCGFISMVYDNSLTPVPNIFVLWFIPIVLVLANYAGSFVIARECSFNLQDDSMKHEYDQHLFEDVYCTNESLLAKSQFFKPINRIRAQLYSVYVGISFLSTMGMQGFYISTNEVRIILMVLSLIGLYLTVAFAGKIVTLYFLHHRLLLQWQGAMRCLKRFLKIIKVNPQLVQAIIYHYEIKWSQQKGRAVHNVFEILSLQIQSDVLFEIYGMNLYNASIFKSKTKSFFKNLVPKTRQEIICKEGYAVTINDVTKYIYIVCKGEFEILAPDGTVTATVLCGGMFGNLQNKKRSRLRISAVACCHTEVLIITALEFHKLLEYEPQMKDEYIALIRIYFNYIPGNNETKKQIHNDNTYKTQNIKKSIWLYVFNPNTLHMQIWNAINLTFSCYVCIILDLYQLGSTENSVIMLVMQYTCDVLYAAQYCLKFRIAYEDEWGTLVTDLRQIAKKQCENKFRLLIGTISILPLDIIVLTMKNLSPYHRMLFFGLLRLNRLLRLMYVFEYFSITNWKLNVNIYAMRCGFIILWCSLTFCTIAALTTIISCPFNINIQPHVANCTAIIDMTSGEKFRIFVRHIYLAANFMNFAAQNTFFPDGALHTIFFITVMLISEALLFVSISQIYSLISECSINKEYYINNRDRIKTFMNNEDVSLSLIDRIITYVDMLWLKNRGNNYPVLLQEAPRYLQDAILNDVFRHLLQNHCVFAKCHRDCLRQIIQKGQTETFFNGDYVQFKGVIDNCMYFIFDGEIIVLKDESVYDKDIVRVLRNGDTFGVKQGLHYKIPHDYSYQSTKQSILVIIDFNRWDYLLRYFPAAKENIYSALETYTGY